MARSLKANCQRCVNLYPEHNQEDAPTPITQYPTPGLVQLAATPFNVPIRGLYTASNGNLYMVGGNKLYFVTAGWGLTLLGSIGTQTGPVSMLDNKVTMVLVDGSTTGYTIELSTNTFAVLDDPTGLFNGSWGVGYIDGYMLFPTDTGFISTLANVIQFDGTYTADKNGAPDLMGNLATLNRQLWLVGQGTSEIWYNVGGVLFPFATQPGAFIQHGIAARASLAGMDKNLFWLGKDEQGHGVVWKGQGYECKRISTHALEGQIQSYGFISDALGWTYQQDGHWFYVLTFPSADRTWVWDETTEMWHERMWLDADGREHRHRANCHAAAYGVHVVGDWQNGKLYRLDLDVYTDAGATILRRRSFPHITTGFKEDGTPISGDGKRIQFRSFIADMECGTIEDPNTDPQVYLRWSDSGGKTWGVPISQTLGRSGAYLTSMQWQNLGFARDRVFELFWSVNAETALQGAFIDPKVLGS